jgi:peptide deformylase
VAVRAIRLFGDPILKSATRPVTDLAAATGLITDLLDTTSLPGRAGVAATQIGVGLSAFAFSVDGEMGYLINPEIVALEGQAELVEEGCLSVPGLWHPVSRFPIASVRGLQLDGSTIEIKGEGLMAQALQHETDHLQGTLYLDRLSAEERKKAFRSLRDQDWFTSKG